MLKEIYDKNGFKYMTLDFNRNLSNQDIILIKNHYELFFALKLIQVNDNKQLVFQYIGGGKNAKKK